MQAHNPSLPADHLAPEIKSSAPPLLHQIRKLNCNIQQKTGALAHNKTWLMRLGDTWAFTQRKLEHTEDQGQSPRLYEEAWAHWHDSCLAKIDNGDPENFRDVNDQVKDIQALNEEVIQLCNSQNQNPESEIHIIYSQALTRRELIAKIRDCPQSHKDLEGEILTLGIAMITLTLVTASMMFAYDGKDENTYYINAPVETLFCLVTHYFFWCHSQIDQDEAKIDECRKWIASLYTLADQLPHPAKKLELKPDENPKKLPLPFDQVFSKKRSLEQNKYKRTWDRETSISALVFHFFSSEEMGRNRRVSSYWLAESQAPSYWQARLFDELGVKIAESKNLEEIYHRLSRVKNNYPLLGFYQMMIHLNEKFPPLYANEGENKLDAATRQFYYQEAKRLNNPKLLQWLTSPDRGALQIVGEQKAQIDQGNRDFLKAIYSVAGRFACEKDKLPQVIDRFRHLHQAIELTELLFKHLTDDFSETAKMQNSGIRPSAIYYFRAKKYGFTPKKYNYPGVILERLKNTLVEIGFHYDHVDYVQWLVSNRGCRVDAQPNQAFMDKPHFLDFLPAHSLRRQYLNTRVDFIQAATKGDREKLNEILVNFASYLDEETYFSAVSEAVGNRHFKAGQDLILASSSGLPYLRLNIQILFWHFLERGNVVAVSWLLETYPAQARLREDADIKYAQLPSESIRFVLGLHPLNKKQLLELELENFLDMTANKNNEALILDILDNELLSKELVIEVSLLHPSDWHRIKRRFLARYQLNSEIPLVKIITKLGHDELDITLLKSVIDEGNIKLMTLLLKHEEIYSELNKPEIREILLKGLNLPLQTASGGDNPSLRAAYIKVLNQYIDHVLYEIETEKANMPNKRWRMR